MKEDHKWFAYRALRAYPTKQTLVFLAEAIKAEFAQIEGKNFDSRNYFYIAESMDVIVQKFEENNTPGE